MFDRIRVALPAASLLALSLLAVAPAATGADTSQGRALYESRCDACHDKSVHSRDARKSRNFAEIRGWVARWNAELGGAWKDDEINAVTRYLNDRYYKFRCPPQFCNGEKA